MSLPDRRCLLSTMAALAIACEPHPELSRQHAATTDSSGPESLKPTPILSGSFAYVDSSGTQLLALGSLADSSRIGAAVCSGGRTFHVQYDRTQVRLQTDNGRQVVSNFANEGGHVFRLLQGRAELDETCFLSPDSLLIANARAVRSLEPSTCSATDSLHLAAAKERQVDHCWHFAETPMRAQLFAVQFVRIGSDALASVVIVRDSLMLFQDFPAIYRGPDEGVWRVDDQGTFSPEGFEVLFVAEFAHPFVMAVAWAGSEGESERLMVADSSDAFRTVVQDYRYWVPE